MKSYVVTATIGKVPGYAWDGKTAKHITPEYIQEFLLKLSADRKYYVSFIMTDATCVYKKEWGCPDGGEPVTVFQATMNPEFVDDPEQWKEDALYYISKLKNVYAQSTVTVTITEADIVYLK